MNRGVRRRLQRIVQKDKDANHRRRATAMLILRCTTVSETARLVSASRSSIRDWRRRYEQFGEAGLVPESQGRPAGTVNETTCCHLLKLIQEQPSDYGYLGSRWTSEMLARQLYESCSVVIHSSTVRRLLPKLGIRWNRARPTLCIKDPTKARKMRAINKALRNNSAQTPVFYVDEADIDLNPRLVMVG
jgi:transposase